MLKMSTGSIEASPSPSPGSFNTSFSTTPGGVPKLGTLVPNRVFVGGISSSTTESELHQLFSEFGNVKQTKIIADRAGVSKGYGFVTFETEEEARRLQATSEDIVLKERKLNIAPAIKKQQTYGRSYEMGQPVINGAIYYHNGIPYTYQQNGVAMFVAEGQPCLGQALLSPTGKASTGNTPFSVVYPGAGNTMFLPSPTPGGHAPGMLPTPTPQHNPAILPHHHLQIQAATALREAVHSQNPGCGGTPPGSNPAPAWRWTSPQSSSGPAPVSCSQSSVPNQSQSTPQSVNQALSFAQDSPVWVPSVYTPQPPSQPILHPRTPLFTHPMYYAPRAQFPPPMLLPQQGYAPVQQVQDGFTPVTPNPASFQAPDPSYQDPRVMQTTGDTLMQGVNYPYMYGQQVILPDGTVCWPVQYTQPYITDTQDYNSGSAQDFGAADQQAASAAQQAAIQQAAPAANQQAVSFQAAQLAHKKVANQKAALDGDGMEAVVQSPGGDNTGCQTCVGEFTNIQPRMSEDSRNGYQGGDVFYPETRFRFPSFSGPLTPITPSVEPVAGSKIGYIVPQTPNTLTNTQFFSSGQGQEFPGCSRFMSPLTPTFNSSPHPDTTRSNPGELERSRNHPPTPREKEHHQLFDTPFKRYVPFLGNPAVSRFPLQRAPSSSSNRGHRWFRPNRLPFGPSSPRHAPAPRHAPSQRLIHSPRRTSEHKASFYQAGDRFGQKTQVEDGNKDESMEDVNSPLPVLGNMVLDQPDLIQVQTARKM